MDVHELNEWFAFERVFGPLTVQERIFAVFGVDEDTESDDKVRIDGVEQQRPRERNRRATTPDGMIALMRVIQAKPTPERGNST